MLFPSAKGDSRLFRSTHRNILMVRQYVVIHAKSEKRVDLLAVDRSGACGQKQLYGKPVIRCVAGAKHKEKEIFSAS